MLTHCPPTTSLARYSELHPLSQDPLRVEPCPLATPLASISKPPRRPRRVYSEASSTQPCSLPRALLSWPTLQGRAPPWFHRRTRASASHPPSLTPRQLSLRPVPQTTCKNLPVDPQKCSQASTAPTRREDSAQIQCTRNPHPTRRSTGLPWRGRPRPKASAGGG